MIFFRQSLVIAGKDLRSELRTKESINAAASFAVVILVLFSLVIDLTDVKAVDLSGGLLWLVFAFAGALILNRSFSRELPNDCLDSLLASPLSPAALFFGKALANFVLVLAVELFCLPVFGVFYNLDWTRKLGWLLAVVALATWGMTVIGTMFSALTVNLRLRELMLPTLVYPILIPALMAAMQLTTLLIAGNDIAGDQLLWLRLLIGFDIIFTALSLAFVETILVG
jgi:heme exporter protein B